MVTVSTQEHKILAPVIALIIPHPRNSHPGGLDQRYPDSIDTESSGSFEMRVDGLDNIEKVVDDVGESFGDLESGASTKS